MVWQKCSGIRRSYLEGQRLHAEQKQKKAIAEALQAHLCEENAS